MDNKFFSLFQLIAVPDALLAVPNALVRPPIPQFDLVQVATHNNRHHHRIGLVSKFIEKWVAVTIIQGQRASCRFIQFSLVLEKVKSNRCITRRIEAGFSKWCWNVKRICLRGTCDFTFSPASQGYSLQTNHRISDAILLKSPFTTTSTVLYRKDYKMIIWGGYREQI